MDILSRLFDHDKHRPGVYTIRNRITGCEYIGMTTRPMTERWFEHQEKLNRGVHHNKRLQADWDAYGSRAFRFVAIEVVDDISLVSERERHWQSQGYTQEGRYNPPVGTVFCRQQPEPSIPRENIVAVCKDLREHGFTRAEARQLLRELGVSFSNELWAEFAPQRRRPSECAEPPLSDSGA